MKKTNLRQVSILAIILCCVSLISIGFATWVITIPSSDSQEGNIKVEEVEERAIEFTTSWYDSDANDGKVENEIIFGAPADATRGWLISNNKINTGEVEDDGSTVYKEAPENLSVILKVDFTTGTKADLALYDFVFDFAVDKDSVAGYNSLLGINNAIAGVNKNNNKYITAPKYYMATTNTVSTVWKEITNEDPNAATYINTVFSELQNADATSTDLCDVYIKIVFTWGDYFKPSKYAAEGETGLDNNLYNPYVFFNQKLYKRDVQTKALILDEDNAKQLIGASDVIPGSITNEKPYGITYAEEAANVLNDIWNAAGNSGKGIKFVLTFGAKTKA